MTNDPKDFSSDQILEERQRGNEIDWSRVEEEGMVAENDSEDIWEGDGERFD